MWTGLTQASIPGLPKDRLACHRTLNMLATRQRLYARDVYVVCVLCMYQAALRGAATAADNSRPPAATKLPAELPDLPSSGVPCAASSTI
jgi:hypothetical protein